MSYPVDVCCACESRLGVQRVAICPDQDIAKINNAPGWSKAARFEQQIWSRQKQSQKEIRPVFKEKPTLLQCSN
jgi:hypothetical protein